MLFFYKIKLQKLIESLWPTYYWFTLTFQAVMIWFIAPLERHYVIHLFPYRQLFIYTRFLDCILKKKIRNCPDRSISKMPDAINQILILRCKKYLIKWCWQDWQQQTNFIISVLWKSNTLSHIYWCLSRHDWQVKAKENTWMLWKLFYPNIGCFIENVIETLISEQSTIDHKNILITSQTKVLYCNE